MKDYHKLSFKFSEYTGNFEREFVAFMFGYEDENSYGDYVNYIKEYEKAGSPLENLKESFYYTAQEVDDWTEETFYNIAPYKDEKECNGIFVQLKRQPTEQEMATLKEMAKKFIDYYKEQEFAQKDAKILAMSVEQVSVNTKTQNEVEFE